MGVFLHDWRWAFGWMHGWMYAGLGLWNLEEGNCGGVFPHLLGFHLSIYLEISK